MSTTTKKVCKGCNGFGHDKAARPVVKFVKAKRGTDKTGKDHITLKQGSGCLWCGGVGFTLCENEVKS